MNEKLKITYQDLSDPKVDEVLARFTEEMAFRKGSGGASDELKKASLLHKSWFNLMIAGLIGAFVAWALIEPHVVESDEGSNSFLVLMLLTVGGFAGLMIGSMEGILARNISRALKAGIVGLLIGFAGGFISLIVAGMVHMIVTPLGVSIIGPEAAYDPVHHFSGFMLAVITRCLLWTVIGMTVGLGPGIGLRSKKLVLNGFLGGMIGGAIGGLLFDPINFVVSGGTFETGVAVSRAIGFCVVGAATGLMIGLVETLTKESWFLMTAGFLKGKQFIVYKNPTIIGSSPKCEIYLFKDTAIEPFHAAIHTLRDGYEIEDLNTPSGTWMNGRKVKRQRLANGDKIQIGNTIFTYSEKEKKSKG